MSNKTVLTEFQIGNIAAINWDRDTIQCLEFARDIEQAVLNSDQVQEWKRDVGRINAMEQKRILVTPEYEGGWHAEIYGDQENPMATGYGDCPRAAIDAAMENRT